MCGTGMELFEACEDNDASRVTELLQKAEGQRGIDSTHGLYDQTALIVACSQAGYGIVKTLLDRGANIQSEDLRGDMCIHTACRSQIDALAKVKAILEIDPSLVHKKGANQETPIYLAARAKDVILVTCLLRKGADVSISNEHGFTPVHIAALKEQTAIIDKLLTHDMTLLNKPDHFGFTPLHRVAQTGLFYAVKMLTSYEQCDIGAKNDDGKTALDLAKSDDHTDIVQLLSNITPRLHTENSDSTHNTDVATQVKALKSHLVEFQDTIRLNMPAVKNPALKSILNQAAALANTIDEATLDALT